MKNLVAGLALAMLWNAAAQTSPTFPTTRSVSNVVASAEPAVVTPKPAIISAEKLTDAREIAQALGTGTAKIIVTLSPPAALTKTDFASRASLAALRPQIKKSQQDVIDQLPINHVKVRHQFDNIAGFSAEVSPDGLKALQTHPRVISIEPVFVLQPHLAQGIPLIHGMAYRSTYNGAGLAIAICDSGVDYNHPRLGGGGFPNGKVLGGYDFGDNDANPIPNGESHGTACAGIAAGDLGSVGDYIGGVAYNAKIYALKITTGTGGSATTADMVAAWDWCVTHKDDNVNSPIMVISTSFGGGQYFATCDSAAPSMTTAANNAVAAGITVLASSGNEGYCDSIAWPSCVSSVISVGAVYDANFGQYQPCVTAESCAQKISTSGCSSHWYVEDTTAADKVTAYANVASFLTLLAPGNQCATLDIVGSAGYSSGDYYAEFGGTSAACPYAAGAVACLQSAARELMGNYLTPSEVRSRLMTLGDNVTDTKVAITKPRVNLERVIQSLGTNPVLNFVSATLIGGNGNQSVDPNECNELRVVVRNDGLSDATNIFATLSSSTLGVSLVQQSSAYPNLAAGATGTNAPFFKINTSPSFACGTPVNLTLILNYGGFTNTNSFSIISGSTNYIITQSNGTSIVSGTTDIGNHGDDILTAISLPFAYTFYGQTFSSATVSSDGNLQFTGSVNNFANACLPASGFNDSIFAFWDDLRTDGTVGAAQGIYTSTSGVSPNRIFNIEWRASYYHPGRKGNPVNFEVRLYENLSRFDLVYGNLTGNGASATVGAQKSLAGPFAEFECNTGGLSNGLQLAFQTICVGGGGSCGSPVANFYGTPTNGLAPLTVSFTNLSTGATSYSWNFGDGKTSTAVNPNNTYTNAGSYTVNLTAVGAGGTNFLTRVNYVVATNPPPPVVPGFAANVTNGTAPLTVSFTNLSSGATSYVWNFGDGKTSASANPGNTYTNAGSYTVTLTAIGAGGTNTLARTNYIVATNPPPPLANFSSGPTNGLAPLTVSFTNLSSGATSYVWNFGDGKTSASANPGNTYTNAGSYTVTLTAIGAGGTNTLSRTNYIVATNLPPPLANFTSGPTNGLAPLTVSFTNLSSGATNYVWSFGDGKTSASANPGNTYTNAGSYTVTLTAIGAGGTNTLTRTNYIVATNLPPPIANFSSDSTNGLAPLMVSFTNLSSGATNYVWSFGDGETSASANPGNTYTNAGSYTVTLTAIGAGGTNTLSRTNYIVATNLPPPIANFSSDSTNGLAPLMVSFTNLSSGATNYVWSFGDGETSASANPGNTYTNAGSYTVTLTAIGAGGTNTLSRTNYIVATNLPPPIANFNSDSTNGLAPLTVSFTNLSSGATSYVWSFGDGETSASANPGNTYTNAGSYTVTLTAIGAGGTNTLARTNYIVVSALPPIANFSADVTNGVVPLSVNFTNLSSGAVNYNWNFGNGQTSFATNAATVYTNAGNYSVELTAVGEGGTNTLTRTNYIIVTNPPPPVSDFVAGPTNGVAPLTVSFTNLSSGATSYAWNFGDGSTSAVEHPTNIYTNAGNYSVTLTAVGLGGTNILIRTNYIIVITPAQLVVTPASLDFGLIMTGATMQAALIVSNAGAATLEGVAAIASGPFTILSGTPYSLAQSGATNLVINFTSTTAGIFSNAVVFTSAGGASTNTIVGRASGAPVIVALTLNDSEFGFSFDTVPGIDYVIQYKNSLDNPQWQTLQSLPGDGSMKTVTNSISASQNFYRLLLQ